MKIVLLCETLESGRSGVGDYSIRLSCAVRQQGHDCRLVAFSDGYLNKIEEGARMLSGISVPFVRLPAALCPGERRRLLLALLKDWDPDWTSLQFVPYSFHPKGIVQFSDFTFTTDLGGRHHAMIHETWIGAHPGASWKSRLIGAVQRSGCRRALLDWRPQLLHTSCHVYQKLMGLAGFEALILPMFGTVEPIEHFNPGDLWKRIHESKPELSDVARDQVRLTGVFGSIHDTPALLRALMALHRKAQEEGLRIVLCLLGRQGDTARMLLEFLTVSCPELTTMQILDSEEASLSSIFHQLDLGLTTTPLDGIGKSSAAATLRDHGLPVLSCDRGAFVGVTNPPFYWVDDFIHQDLLQSRPRFVLVDRVHQVASQLLSDLAGC